MVAIRNTKSKTDISLPIHLLRNPFDMWDGLLKATISPQLLDGNLKDTTTQNTGCLAIYGYVFLGSSPVLWEIFHLFPAFQTQDDDFASMSLYKRYTAKPSYWGYRRGRETRVFSGFNKRVTLLTS
jgi:hypothetical protein